MTGLHEALNDIAAEISPVEPPVERAMLRGRRMRFRRRTGAVAGTAGVMAVAVGAAVGIPSLTTSPGGAPVGSGLGGAPRSSSPPGATGKQAGPSGSIGDAPLARPVLLIQAQGSTQAYGNPHLVDRATMRLFSKITCTSSASPAAVNDDWKAAAGYTAAQWNAAGSQTVSCDSSGTKYALGQAVVTGADITSAAASQLLNSKQWVISVGLDSKGTSAFAHLTTTQYESDYLAFHRNPRDISDQVLASTAIVVNGDVQSAPVTAGPITSGQLMISGPPPSGFTQAQASGLAKYLAGVR